MIPFRATSRNLYALLFLLIILAIIGFLFFADTATAGSKKQVPVTTVSTSSTSTTTTTTLPPTTTTVYIPPPPKPAPVIIPTGDIWEALRNCEAGGDYTKNTGNGYYGAYQFSKSTWDSWNTGYEYAHLAPPEVQDATAILNQQRGGWGQWPACTRLLGLR